MTVATSELPGHLPKLSAPEAEDALYPAPRYSWYVVAILCFAYATSFIDRQILGLLIVPIQEDLGLSDSMLSLLYGLAFSISYTLMGLPMGRLADRFNRSALIACSAAVWSAMTLACGLAQNTVQLFLARLGVGVGESGLSPSAMSLIADYFPRRKRALAVSIYVMGTPLGSALALIAGGAVIAAVAGTTVDLPLLGVLTPWRLTFVLVAVPGFLVAILMFTVREVVRKDVLHNQSHVSMGEVVRFVRERWQLYGGHNLGMSIASLLTNGFAAWIPTYLIRTFGWTPGEAGLRLGSIILICGTSGVVSGGLLASWLARRGVDKSSFIVACLGMVCLTPFAIAAPLIPNATVSSLMFGPYIFFATFPTGCAAAALLEVTPNQMRGYMIALYLFAAALIGMILGPSSIAFVTDFVFEDKMQIGRSMALVAMVACPLSVFFLYQALRAARRMGDDWRGG